MDKAIANASRFLDDEGRSSGSSLGQVFDDGDMPVSLPGMFAIHPASITAEETEGAVPDVEVDADTTIHYLVVGGRMPEPGDLLVAELIDGLWVALPSGKQDTDIGLLKVTGLVCGPNQTSIPSVGASVRVYNNIYGINGDFVKGPNLLRAGTLDETGTWWTGLRDGRYWVEADDYQGNFWVTPTPAIVTTSTVNAQLGFNPKSHWTCGECHRGGPGPAFSDTVHVSGGGADLTLTKQFNLAHNPDYTHQGCQRLHAYINVLEDCSAASAGTRGPGEVLCKFIYLCASQLVILASQCFSHAGSGVVPWIGGSMLTSLDPPDCEGNLPIPGGGGEGAGVGQFFSLNPGAGLFSTTPPPSWSQDYRMYPWNFGGYSGGMISTAFWPGVDHVDFIVTESTPYEVGRYYEIYVTVNIGAANGRPTLTKQAFADITIKDSETGEVYATGQTFAGTIGGTGFLDLFFYAPKRKLRVDITATKGAMIGEVKDFVAAPNLNGGINPITFSMGPKIPVSGRVTDCLTGDPVAGVEVYISTPPKGTGIPNYARATTDSDGRYSLEVWTSADWDITFKHPNYANTSAGIEILGGFNVWGHAYNSVYVPFDTSNAAMTINHGLYLALMKTRFIVTHAITGAPVEGVTIHRFGDSFIYGITDPDGILETFLPRATWTTAPSGAYQVFTQKTGYIQQTFTSNPLMWNQCQYGDWPLAISQGP